MKCALWLFSLLRQRCCVILSPVNKPAVAQAEKSERRRPRNLALIRCRRADRHREVQTGTRISPEFGSRAPPVASLSTLRSGGNLILR